MWLISQKGHLINLDNVDCIWVEPSGKKSAVMAGGLSDEHITLYVAGSTVVSFAVLSWIRESLAFPDAGPIDLTMQPDAYVSATLFDQAMSERTDAPEVPEKDRMDLERMDGGETRGDR